MTNNLVPDDPEELRKQIEKRIAEIDAELNFKTNQPTLKPKKKHGCLWNFANTIAIAILLVAVFFVTVMFLSPSMGAATPFTYFTYSTPTPLPTHSEESIEAWGGYNPPYPTATPSGLKPYEVPWAMVQDFLNTDLTKYNYYQSPKYMCVQFAMDVVSNANRAGITAYVVELIYETPSDISVVIPGWKGPLAGHDIVGFPTTDRGVVYYDAQLNRDGQSGVVTIGIGESECPVSSSPNASVECSNIYPGQTWTKNNKVYTAVQSVPLIISAIHTNVKCNYLTSVCYLHN